MSVETDVARVDEATRSLLVPGEVDVIAVFAWHGVSLRLWKGDPSTCGPSCIQGHGKCGKSSRYFGLHTREAVDGFLADLPALGLLAALARWGG